jgi:hypothetical protein
MEVTLDCSVSPDAFDALRGRDLAGKRFGQRQDVTARFSLKRGLSRSQKAIDDKSD